MTASFASILYPYVSLEENSDDYLRSPDNLCQDVPVKTLGSLSHVLDHDKALLSSWVQKSIHLVPSPKYCARETINHQTVNHQQSTINSQPSTVNHQPSTINHQPSTIKRSTVKQTKIITFAAYSNQQKYEHQISCTQFC